MLEAYTAWINTRERPLITVEETGSFLTCGVTRVEQTRFQFGEQGLNLNRSWHGDHSHAYNTPFFLGRIRRICLFEYLLELSSPTAPSLSHGGRTVLCMIIDRSLGLSS